MRTWKTVPASTSGRSTMSAPWFPGSRRPRIRQAAFSASQRRCMRAQRPINISESTNSMSSQQPLLQPCSMSPSYSPPRPLPQPLPPRPVRTPSATTEIDLERVYEDDTEGTREGCPSSGASIPGPTLMATHTTIRAVATSPVKIATQQVDSGLRFVYETESGAREPPPVYTRE